MPNPYGGTLLSFKCIDQMLRGEDKATNKDLVATRGWMIIEDMGVDVTPKKRCRVKSGGLQREWCKGLWQLGREA